MVSKSILAVVAIVAILVIGGGIYMMQQPSAPTATPTPTTTPTTTSEPQTTTTPEAKESPTREEINEISEAVTNYLDTYNQHSVEDNVACFTNDGEKRVASGFGTVSSIGHDKIRAQLKDVFQSVPDISLELTNIQVLDVKDDTASAMVTFVVNSETEGWSRSMNENIDFVKIGDTWKIVEAYTEFKSVQEAVR